MIKRFCDICCAEIERNVTSNRLEGFVAHRRDASGAVRGPDHGVQFQVTAGIGKGHSNDGDLCMGCLIDAINTMDPRPRLAE